MNLEEKTVTENPKSKEKGNASCWEYRTEESPLYPSDSDLNTLGLDGWELVTILRCEDFVRSVFKRPKLA